METCDKVADEVAVVVRNVGGSSLSTQQATIFALLNRKVGNPVPIATILTVLDAISMEDSPTVGSVKVQIHRVRKKVAGQYRIDTVIGVGYQMHPVRFTAFRLILI